ncbi:hypothetical protein [Nocardia brasiliensis]|uniref:hypothetical protein n=1 Tax=Nocardia brasiliensis TaxID=37326 RepID=UPI002457B802|nr:hypothetical protein [Nocardia brasiliensis]
MNALRKWWNEEPLATRVGPVVVLVVGYLVSKGFVDHATEDLIIGIAAAILGGGALVTARAKVWPELKLPAAVRALLRPVSGDED